ncbi:MAG: hypothetical protein ABI836_10080 [Gemmatimonadota bacterium]
MLVLLAAGARCGWGQDVASIRRRIAQLEQMKMELNAAADSHAALEGARRLAVLDSLSVGPLRLLAPHQSIDFARRVGEAAWTALRGRLEDSVAMVLHQRRFVLIPEDPADSTQTKAQGYATLGTVLVVPGNRPASLTALEIIVPVYGDLWRTLDPSMREWLSGPVTPTLDTVAVSSSNYLELVTSGSPVARGCYQGRMEDCEEALGLVRPADPAMAWYSVEGRRELVGRLGQVLRTGVTREVFTRCVVQHVDADCVALLHQDEALVPPPLSGSLRASYLLTALKLGETGSLARLLGSSEEASVARRLELTAGTSLSTLTARWHSAVLAMRLNPIQLTASTAGASVVWMAGLLLLATRSSRWR